MVSRLISRRRMLQNIGTLTSTMALKGITLAESETLIHSKVIISMQSDLYHGWPTLTQRSNGELLLVCSGGRESKGR